MSKRFHGLIIAGLMCGLGSTGIAEPATTGPSSTKLDFATFGIALAPPAGWSRIPEGNPANIVRWAKIDARGKLGGLITIDMAPQENSTLRSFAERQASDGKGTVADAGFRVDGEETEMLTGLHQQGASCEKLVTSHEKRFYTITALADTETNIPRSEMSAIAQSIRFSPVESPVAHLELRGQRFPLLGAFTLEPLAIMRPSPTPAGKDTVMVGVTDFSTGGVPVVMGVQTITLEKDVPLAQLQAGFPGKLAPPGTTLKWSRVEAPLESVMSDAFMGDAGNTHEPMSFAIVRLEPKRYVLFNFNYPATRIDSTPVYLAALRHVVASVQPIAAR